MEQLQTIDLILGIILKVVIIVGFLLLIPVVLRIQRAAKQVEIGANLLNYHVQNIANRVQTEFTLENFTAKIQGMFGGVLKGWLVGTIGKEISLLLRKRNRK